MVVIPTDNREFEMNQYIAAFSYRMSGSKHVETMRFNLGDPDSYKQWEDMVDTLRAHENADGTVTPGMADYFVTSFEVE